MRAKAVGINFFAVKNQLVHKNGKSDIVVFFNFVQYHLSGCLIQTLKRSIGRKLSIVYVFLPSFKTETVVYFIEMRTKTLQPINNKRSIKLVNFFIKLKRITT